MAAQITAQHEDISSPFATFSARLESLPLGMPLAPRASTRRAHVMKNPPIDIFIPSLDPEDDDSVIDADKDEYRMPALMPRSDSLFLQLLRGYDAALLLPSDSSDTLCPSPLALDDDILSLTDSSLDGVSLVSCDSQDKENTVNEKAAAPSSPTSIYWRSRNGFRLQPRRDDHNHKPEEDLENDFRSFDI